MEPQNTDKEVEMPEHVIQVCREMGKVAKENGLLEMSGKFRPKRGWGGEVSFSWKAGRHGEDGDHISITTQFFASARLSIPKLQNDQ
jgi:hypothetical protein